jgi:D-alanyl-D-alanine carboxypeptidase
MRVAAFSLCALLCACSSSGGDPTCPELEAALELAIDDWGSRENIPGAILGVAVPGCRGWQGATGLAVRSPRTDMRPDHLFSIWSVTKTFTAAVVLQLVEEGELSLEDPLATWFADFPNGDSITIRHLLNHTAGIYNYTDSRDFNADLDAQPDRIWAPQELVDYALAEAPLFAPGQGWYYCNTGFILLGMIIERVTGNSIAVEIRTRLLEPLKLTHTFFDGLEEVHGEMAHEYALNGEDLTYRYHPSWGWAAGAMVSDTGDLLTWIQALFNGEVFSRELVNEMMDPTEAIGDSSYGLGLWIKQTDSGGTIWGHDGHGLGSQVELYFEPDLDAYMLAFVNCYLLDCLGGAWYLFNAGAIPAVAEYQLNVQVQ